MSFSQDIGGQLPGLRRFARALSGSQSSGDSYVAAALRVAIADPHIIKAGPDLKPELYRLLLTMWDSVAINRADPAVYLPDLPAEVTLQAIPSKPRQALLLTALEGFSVAEAARVMLVSEDKCQSLIEQAGREIAGQLACNVLVIEDEPLVALEVTSLARSMGHAVQQVARTHREAIAAVAQDRPDLVLADIKLADGSSGLEAVQEILRSISVPVIFITAYPERLLTGEKPEPTYLVEKPFKPATVKALIAQALFLGNAREHTTNSCDVAPMTSSRRSASKPLPGITPTA
jgi:CheY-like chemotaxis protein